MKPDDKIQLETRGGITIVRMECKACDGTGQILTITDDVYRSFTVCANCGGSGFR